MVSHEEVNPSAAHQAVRTETTVRMGLLIKTEKADHYLLLL